MLIPASAGAAVPRPTEDPFYAAPAGYAKASPGTVLRSREIDVTQYGAPLDVRGWQVAYATRDTHSAPEAAIATILEPQGAAPPGGRALVAYQPAEDSLSVNCAPSYDIRRGQEQELSQALTPLMQKGAAVVVPDYEGPDSQWVAGIQSGHAVLDAVRASQRFAPAGLGAKTKVGIWGYSGGGLATSWAAELQPSYAPELNVVGIATGGGAGDLRATIAKLDGSPYASLLLAAAVGISRAYPEMGFDGLLNDAGKAMKARIGDQCLNQFASEYPFARLDDFTKVRNAIAVPSVDAVITANDLGQHTPTAPHYVYHSATDELEPIAGMDKLVATYCAHGVRVQYNRAPAGEHIAFSIANTDAAAGYLEDRFDGKPAPDTCPKRAGRPAPKPTATRPLIRLAVSPRRVRGGRWIRYRFQTTAAIGGHRRAIAGATVRFQGRRVKTDRRGRAAMRRRFFRTMRLPVFAGKRGLRSARSSVLVVRSH